MKSRDEFKTEKEYKDYLKTYFAATALQGILSNRKMQLAIIADIHLYANEGCNHENCFAFHAVMNADELLKQLEA